MAATSELQQQFDEITAQRHSFARRFHEIVGTKKAFERIIPQEVSAKISFVEGVFSYLVVHGLNGGDNSTGFDEARDYVWVSGFTTELPDTSYRNPRPRVLFAGLTEYVWRDYFGGQHDFRPGMRLGAIQVDKDRGYKTDDLAMAAKVIDDKHSSNVGSFPLEEYSLDQLKDESFINSSKAKLESQLGFLAEELKVNTPSNSLV